MAMVSVDTVVVLYDVPCTCLWLRFRRRVPFALVEVLLKCESTVKWALRTSMSAYAGQNAPVGGAPGTQAPPDSPGLLVHANASTVG